MDFLDQIHFVQQGHQRCSGVFGVVVMSKLVFEAMLMLVFATTMRFLIVVLVLGTLKEGFHQLQTVFQGQKYHHHQWN